MSELATESPQWDTAFDAVSVAPDNHVILHEDDELRVLLVKLPVGEREPLHHHRWPSVFVIHHIEPIIDFDASGTEQAPPQQIIDAIAGGQIPLIVRMPPQPLHSVENVGNDTIRGIRIEYKQVSRFASI